MKISATLLSLFIGTNRACFKKKSAEPGRLPTVGLMIVIIGG